MSCHLVECRSPFSARLAHAFGVLDGPLKLGASRRRRRSNWVTLRFDSRARGRGGRPFSGGIRHLLQGGHHGHRGPRRREPPRCSSGSSLRSSGQALRLCVRIGAVGAAHGHESRVDVGEVVVQGRVEAAGPGRGHPRSSEPAHQGRGLVVGEPTEWPAREPDVDVDHGLTPFASRIGVMRRRRFSPRMSRRSTSAMSAPSTLASCAHPVGQPDQSGHRLVGRAPAGARQMTVEVPDHGRLRSLRNTW
jgi:hypothetical protein